MKVLKKGTGQKGWAKEKTCTGGGNGGGGCKATLLVEEGDLFQTHSSHYDGSTDHYVTFRCADCGALTDLGSNEYLGVAAVREPEHSKKRKKKA